MWPANLTLFFTFQPISFKQLNSLTTIDTFSWLGGPEVTHVSGVRDVLGSVPGSSKVYVWFCVLLLLCSYLYCKKHTFFCQKLFAIPSAVVIHLVYFVLTLKINTFWKWKCNYQNKRKLYCNYHYCLNDLLFPVDKVAFLSI